jgi:hypothetical protein
MDWSKLELCVFGSDYRAEGLLCMPKDDVLRRLIMERQGHLWRVIQGPLPAGVKYAIQGA